MSSMLAIACLPTASVRLPLDHHARLRDGAATGDPLAIAALARGIAGFSGIPSLAAIICGCGHLALAQTRRSRGAQSGECLARAGLIVRYLSLGLWVAYFVSFFLLPVLIAIVTSVHPGTSTAP